MNVSIVIPTFNSSRYLDRLFLLLDKYLNNDANEVIFIDDFSSDDTVKTILHKQEKYDNLKLYINDKNMGPSYSRNIGIKKSTKEYIAFLDSDDCWHPLKLEIQIKFMKDKNIKICGTDHITIEEEDFYNINKEEKNILKYEVPYRIISWPRILFISPFATPSVVIHSSLKSFLFDEKIRYSEDYNLWKRITYKYKAAKIKLPLTYTFKHDYVSSENSLSSNLLKMQMGINTSFISLINSKKINIGSKLLIVIAFIFSQLKFLRRYINKFIKS